MENLCSIHLCFHTEKQTENTDTIVLASFPKRQGPCGLSTLPVADSSRLIWKNNRNVLLYLDPSSNCPASGHVSWTSRWSKHQAHGCATPCCAPFCPEARHTFLLLFGILSRCEQGLDLSRRHSAGVEERNQAALSAQALAARAGLQATAQLHSVCLGCLRNPPLFPRRSGSGLQILIGAESYEPEKGSIISPNPTFPTWSSLCLTKSTFKRRKGWGQLSGSGLEATSFLTGLSPLCAPTIHLPLLGIGREELPPASAWKCQICDQNEQEEGVLGGGKCVLPVRRSWRGHREHCEPPIQKLPILLHGRQRVPVCLWELPWRPAGLPSHSHFLFSVESPRAPLSK